MTRTFKIALMASVVAGGAFPVSALLAQVAPTEVNEEAVDEFGLERKTGRFSWSTGEIVGIGGEGSRIGVKVLGIRDPADAMEILAGDMSVNLNRPRLFTSQSPLNFPTLSSPAPAPLSGSYRNVTVQYPGGSETFLCWVGLAPDGVGQEISCGPLQGTGSTFEFNGGAYVFTSKHGVVVRFDENSVTVSNPDGRETILEIGREWSNNNGFSVVFSGDNQIAINRAVSTCVGTEAVTCTGGAAMERWSSITSPAEGLEVIRDSAGLETQLGWQWMAARQRRTSIPSDASTFPNEVPNPINYTVTRKYPTSITLPGDNAPSIQVSYAPYAADFDIHEDIRVASITRAGITSTYSYALEYPYGAPPVESRDGIIDPIPDGAGVELSGSWSGSCGGLLGSDLQCTADNDAQRRRDLAACVDVSPMSCLGGGVDFGGGGGSAGGGIPDPPPLEYTDPPPELDFQLELNPPNSPYDNVHRLQVTATIGGTLSYESKALQPVNPFGSSRRHILYVEDANGNQIQPIYNFRDEIAGATFPEGNAAYEEYDDRGNTVRSLVAPKPGSADPVLTTTFTYEPSCDGIPRARCNKPISITDPNGGVTNFEYNDRGQLTRQISPAPTPGAARPTVVNEYEERQAYIKDESGNPVAAGPPISMLIRSYTCISSATCDANTPDTDKVVTEFDYGPTTGLNNLLLRGMTVTAANASGQLETRRTCYEYNYFGERISETLPSANLASCPG